MNRKIDKMVIKCILEILTAAFFIIISYSGIVSNHLHESSAIARTSDDGSYGIQYMFEEDSENLLAHEKILDKGTLSVRNPNRSTKEAKIILILYGDIENLKKLDIMFGNDKINIDNLAGENGKYTSPIEIVKLRGYESYISPVTICGDPNIGSSYGYDFIVEESLIA